MLLWTQIHKSLLRLSLIVGFSFFIYSGANVTYAFTEEEPLDGNVNAEGLPIKGIAGTWKLYNGKSKSGKGYLGTMTVLDTGEIASFSCHMPNDGGLCWSDAGFEAIYEKSSISGNLSFSCSFSKANKTGSVMTVEYSSSLNGKFKKSEKNTL